MKRKGISGATIFNVDSWIPMFLLNLKITSEGIEKRTLK